MNENLDTELEEELEEELDTDIEEENTEDSPEDVEESYDDVLEADDDEEATEDEEELEYDEDGNVIITEKSETEAEEQAEEATDESAPAEETAQPDEKDAEIERLNKRYSDREAQIKETLIKMGVELNEGEDLEVALVRLAAEADGVTPEEYKRKREEELRSEEAARVYKRVLLEKMIADDLAALHAEFPETRGFTKFEDIPNYRRFGELRDAGATAKEAYIAANPDRARDAVASSVRQKDINSTKEHLQSNVPKASKDNSVKVSRAEMEQLRELFPDKSDKEIIALYKKTK